MRKLLSIITLGTAACALSMSGQSLFTETFDDALSIDAWTVAGDPDNETTLTWLPTGGNPGGALEFGGFNTSEAIGKGYIVGRTVTIDFTGATELSFDAILTQPSVGTNVQVQILLDGVGTGFASLSDEGLNEDTWTTFSYDLTSVTPGADTMTMNFLVAAGAFEGAGAVFALDNVSVIPEPSVYAALLGFLAVGLVVARRRAKRA